MYENITRSLNKNQHFWAQFCQQMTGLISSAMDSCKREMSFQSDADPGDSQLWKNHMAASCCQSTPDQENDGMAGHQDRLNVAKCLMGDNPAP